MRTAKSTGPEPGGGGLALPRRIGRYELSSEIASGGMGTVYLGWARGVGGFRRLVAVKCLHRHLLRDEAFVRMFIDEARIAAMIHHPNVVPTLDVAQEDGELFLVMEHVAGVSLNELCREAARRGTWLPVPVSLRVVLDLLRGLAAAHELTGPDGRPLGLIHRDVSPQNVLIGTDGVSRIADFGVAKAEARLAVTDGRALKGKPSYMAPEQISDRSIGQQADLWAAGVVLWELLTGSRLFRGEVQSEIVARVLGAPILPPSELARGTDPLDGVALRALERDVAHRFPTAAAMADAIEGAGVPIATPRTVASFLAETVPNVLEARRAVAQPIESGAVEAPPRNPNDVDETRIEKYSPQAARKRTRWWLAGAVILVATASVAGVLYARSAGDDEAREEPERRGAQADAVAAEGAVDPAPARAEAPSEPSAEPIADDAPAAEETEPSPPGPVAPRRDRSSRSRPPPPVESAEPDRPFEPESI